MLINNLFQNLLAIPMEDNSVSISFEINMDDIKSNLLNDNITKILNFYNVFNFKIEIDSELTFNTINKITYNKSDLSNIFYGTRTISTIIPFNKRQIYGETKYYFRILSDNEEHEYKIISNNDNIIRKHNLVFIDSSNIISNSEINIRKNYTKDILDEMYRLVSDFHSWSKNAKSANLYYWLQPFAVEADIALNKLFETKDNMCLNTANPNSLNYVYGNNIGFNLPNNMQHEEYRRFLKNLLYGFQNGGTLNTINSCLKYLIGYDINIETLQKNFYPFILRYKDSIKDTENPSRSNALSPFYLFSLEKNYDSLPKNKCLSVSNNVKNFAFFINIDNFFNNDINAEAINKTINLLKPAWSKYTMQITNKIIPSAYNIISLNGYFIVTKDNEFIITKEVI